MDLPLSSDHDRGGYSPGAKGSVERVMRSMLSQGVSPLQAWERSAEDHQPVCDLIIDPDFDGGLEHEFATLPIRRLAEPAS